MTSSKAAAALSHSSSARQAPRSLGWRLFRFLLIVAGIVWIAYQPEQGLLGLLLIAYGVSSLIFGRSRGRARAGLSHGEQRQAPLLHRSHLQEQERIELERSQWRASDDHSSFHDDGR